MSAGAVLQAALVARLRAIPGLTQVFDAPPARAAVPFARVDDPVLGDWSTKSWSGREGRVAITIEDGGERPVRLRALIGAVEEVVPEIAPGLGEGWQVATWQLVRSRMTRAGADRWRATAEFAVRMYRQQ